MTKTELNRIVCESPELTDEIADSLTLHEGKYYAYEEFEEKFPEYMTSGTYISVSQASEILRVNWREIEALVKSDQLKHKGTRRTGLAIDKNSLIWLAKNNPQYQHMDIRNPIVYEKAKTVTGYSGEVLCILIRDGLLEYDRGCFNKDEIDRLLIIREISEK